jgi:thioredoxin reductase (NADPH)
MAYAPHLTEAQIDRTRIYAKPRPVIAGEILYQPGSDTPPVFVVISGAIRIIAIGGTEERTVTTYRSAQFSGELLMISGRRSIYGCQAIEDGTLLELSPGDLRTLIAKDAELSEIIMNAFLTRRLSLKETGQGNVVVLGSKYSTRHSRSLSQTPADTQSSDQQMTQPTPGEHDECQQ